MTLNLVIWGAGGHSSVVTDIFRLLPNINIVGYIDDINQSRHGKKFLGLPILGGIEQLDIMKNNNIHHITLAFGNNVARVEKSKLALAKGFSLLSAVHPKATVAIDVQMNPGTVIVAGSVVNTGAIIGSCVIINTLASIEHHCIVEEGAHIAPGVRLGGGVKIRRCAWIGLGAVIKDKVEIGEYSIIGAGAVVLDDIPERVVAYGIPAKIMGEVSIDEKVTIR